MNLLDILKYIIKENNSAFFYTPTLKNNAKSFFFKKPNKIISVFNKNELDEAFEKVKTFTSKKLSGYMMMLYETGYLFEEKLSDMFVENSETPILHCSFFDEENTEIINSSEISFDELISYVNTSEYRIENYELNTDRQTYVESINKIKKYIEEGDTYQVNFTVQGKFNFKGDVIKLFYELICKQSAQYIALINKADHFVISISPELFFEVSKKEITVKPMKGTIRRGHNLESDRIKINELKYNDKNRAENVMIVDLLRNDLGKICELNSVKTKSLFDIETYETLHQMTSTVEGRLNKNDLQEIIKQIYPSGSITGAPKISTMKIIHELEKEPRGYYTGTIGLLFGEKYTFNIPIRTISLNKVNGVGQIGIGSGVVWDSDPENEYDETILKSDFLLKKHESFELIETMLFENNGIYLFEYHLKRISDTADYFLFNFNAELFTDTINKYLSKLDNAARLKIRVTLNKWGKITISQFLLTEVTKPISITISDVRTNSFDTFLYFKTTNRNVYDNAQRNIVEKGINEMIFLNERNEITEGSFTNIFLRKGNKWFTPEISSGLLNGCYRQYLLDNYENYSERKLFITDILDCDEIACVNSLRREMKVSKIYHRNKLIKDFEPEQ